MAEPGAGRIARFATLALILMVKTVSASPEPFSIAAVPDWVKPLPAFDPALERTAEPFQGYRARLRDFQFNGLQAGQSRWFTAVEYELTNRHGVENHSNIELSFDPGYETLLLHELWVLRGDTLIDKLPTARLDLLRTESDRDELIYNGTRTLAIVLDDVRRGDLIRYSYSVEGENPIFDDQREFQVFTEFAVPMDRNHARILTTTDRPLSRRVRGADVAVQVSEENGVQELIVDQQGVPEFVQEVDVPSWHYDRGTMVFSDLTDWRAVVDWAEPMYRLSDVHNAEIATIASVIRSSRDDLQGQIGAALRWVQEEVRYFGVELGKNSHWPSRPEETLARRFGDCKDKSLLLMALLRELGVESQAALVNTNRGLESGSYPYRLHAFNHVVVHLRLGDTVHYLDPTLRNQGGALGQLREPDYGRALVLSPETSSLSDMSSVQPLYRMSVHKSLTPGVEETQLTVVTSKQGSWAENVRHDLETEGKRGLGRVFHSYYADYFDSIVSGGEPEFADGPGDSVLVTEHYRIPQLWQSDENVSRYRWIYADEIIAYLDMPETTTGRRQPYELIHPISIDERWDVSLTMPLRLDDLDAIVENDWFRFSKQSELDDDGQLLSVTFRYRTLANEVAAASLDEYSAAVAEVYDLASFYIEEKPSLGAAVKEATSELAQAGSLHPLLVLLIMLTGLLRPLILRS
ncbi:DUF3857 domain-containing protein [Granulosicoccus sp. 3-233]|uniref:DUF3857 domain-containing protein n=1 Tax=Granulosicoccus sp. 3-233 TaxID=3417969 RepID=UPI003D32BFCA